LRHSRQDRGEATTLLIERYGDFNATFAMENLSKRHQIDLSREKVRELMIEAGIYEYGIKRKTKGSVHQRRPRSELFGELVQIDGSFHDWFEGKSENAR
jgi:hypothetical protein